MATSADIEHISQLVNRLLPLTQIARGDLIRAQDWNLLAGALIDLAHALIALAPDAVPPHAHLEQVKLDWLDPQLRTLLQRGALADPAELARLAAAERAVTDLRGQVDGTGGDVRQLRLELTDLAGRDLDRNAQLQSVKLALNGLGDSKDDLAALRASLAALQDGVNTAVSVGQHLTVDGKPADLQAMSDRLHAVEGFRDGLRAAGGTPLDAAALANQIKQATVDLVTRADLEVILKQRTAVISPDQLQAIKDQLSASLKVDVTAQVTQLATAIKAETDQRLAGIDVVVGRAVGDALPSMTDAVLGKIRPEIAAAVQTGVTQLQAAFDKRIADTVQAARDDLTARLGDLRLELDRTVRDQLQRQLAVSLEPIQKSIADLSVRIDRHDVVIAGHDTAIAAVGQRVAAVSHDEAAARDQLKAELTRSVGDITRRVDDLNTRVRTPIR